MDTQPLLGQSQVYTGKDAGVSLCDQLLKPLFISPGVTPFTDEALTVPSIWRQISSPITPHALTHCKSCVEI